ncbi:tyrosine-type recombinase/integrase [Mucilaginibacter jinjuensis]|uniref:Tyrosine-type recombinase/integrase n=1 Tax=Mucilaginibacter jinjuensis TaxID=1176721 RepID=A0ABY7TBC1_9SPHI|nr:tyrosine-type recombinase/integrase [Mucilaginibacter jinjuensis]WCT13498.1 tyrosine-type recombinase/integrase [Mucilaginibacter jinjuensis]
MLYFYHPDPVKGKPVRLRTYKNLSYNHDAGTLKKKARILVDEIIENIKAERHPLSFSGSDKDAELIGQSTIIFWFDHWLAYRKECFEIGALKMKGYLSSQNICSYFMEWLKDKGFERRAAGSFNHLDIDLFLRTWAKKRGWNKVSVNTYRGHLITFFNYLIALKVITDNPAKHTRKLNLKNDSSRFKIYEEGELRKVVNALIEDESFHDLYIAAKLVYKFNIRPIELIRLQVKDINFRKRLLTLPPDKTKNGNEARFLLDEESLFMLETFLKDHDHTHYIFGRRTKVSDYQACDGYLDQRWRAFRKKHDIPSHLKFYALKHSSNYYDLQDGASFEEIRQRNRHSNLQVTTLYIKERLFKNVIKASGSSKFDPIK